MKDTDEQTPDLNELANRLVTESTEERDPAPAKGDGDSAEDSPES